MIHFEQLYLIEKIKDENHHLERDKKYEQREHSGRNRKECKRKDEQLYKYDEV
jgi:hypothetical protein